MRPIALTFAAFFAVTQLAAAEVVPSAETARRVAAASEAFLDQIVKGDFAAERAFLAPRLAEIVSAEEWAAVRQNTIGLAGKTQRYAVHRTTWYQQGGVLAAVDFSGSGGLPDTLVCGFLLWEVPEASAPGLLRFEQNVVTVALFRKMPVQEAAQTMVSWRCPSGLIEATLGVRLE